MIYYLKNKISSSKSCDLPYCTTGWTIFFFHKPFLHAMGVKSMIACSPYYFTLYFLWIHLSEFTGITAFFKIYNTKLAFLLIMFKIPICYSVPSFYFEKFFIL